MSFQLFRDFSSDSGRQLLHKLATKHDFPQYVRDATPDALSTSGHTTKCAQLIPEARLPTHTKAATWLSYACFAEQRNEVVPEEVKKVAAYLADKAEFWGIEDDIAAVDRTNEEVLKIASEHDDRYPVRNPLEAKLANEWLNTQLDEDRPSINVTARVELANKIAEFVTPKSNVAKLTKLSGCYNGKALAAKIKAAAEKEESDEAKDKLTKLADHVFRAAPRELDLSHVKIAQYIENVSDNITRPEFFTQVNTTEPVVMLRNGAVVETVKLAGFKSSALDAAEFEAGYNWLVKKNAADRNVKSATDMSEELANELCNDLRMAGIRLEVEPRPRAMSLFDFE